MNALEETANYWLEKGVATLPIRWKSKVPEVKSWAEYTERLPTSTELEQWYINPWHNIAVITGWRNLCILDFDEMDRYNEWIDWAWNNSCLAWAVSQSTRICMSARGVHVYLYTREKGRNMKLNKLDVLCDRKYALTAPSIHPSGKSYSVMFDNTPCLIDSVVDVIPPAWIREAEEEHRALMEDDLLREIAEGQGARGQGEMGLVAKIKSAWRIEDFFPERNPSGGGWYSVRCPLHDDRRPSAGVNVDQQIFTCFQHCYGSRPLDVIGLYAKMHGISNSEAIRKMSEELGVRSEER